VEKSPSVGRQPRRGGTIQPGAGPQVVGADQGEGDARSGSCGFQDGLGLALAWQAPDPLRADRRPFCAVLRE
jgi:hypothetical protein